MAVVEQEPANTSEISNFRYSRIAVKRDRSPKFCFWLQAAVQRIVIYVGFSSSSGSLIWIRARIHQIV